MKKTQESVVEKTTVNESKSQKGELERRSSAARDHEKGSLEKKSSHVDRTYTPKELGKRGEKAAAKFLERRGFEVVERNWTCYAGEADIIAIQDDTLCFVEVKTRSDCQKGFPSEAVDGRKRDRYERIAACYLKDRAFDDMRVRFDVISILALNNDRAFLRHHVNAFGSM